MSRLNQIIRNLFIRIEAFISVLFRQISSFFAGVFGLFAKVFGFSDSGYFLESDQAQTAGRAQTQQLPETESVKAPETSTTIRRRPKTKMDDYYLNMAKDVKKS